MFLRDRFKKTKSAQPVTTATTQDDKYCPKLISRDNHTSVQTIVGKFLTTQDIINVSKACRGSRALFATSRSIDKLHNLLQAAANGDLKIVEKIIKTDPTLLLKSGTVTDLSGRIHFNRTAFQLALGACDYNVRDDRNRIVVRGMVEKIEPHFYRLPGMTREQIRKIIHEQYVGQFPKDHEALLAKRVAEDSAALNGIVKVIADLKDEKECTAVSKLDEEIHKIVRKEKPERADALKKLVQDLLKAASKDLFDNAFEAFKGYLTDNKLLTDGAVNMDLLKALYQFRWHLEPKGNQTTGKHFNHQLLAEVARLYDENYAQFGNHWNSPKNEFYWQKVLGGVERHVSICDAQVIAYGLWSLFGDGNQSTRTLAFGQGGERKHPDGGGHYFPLTLDPDWEIGYNCACLVGRWRAAHAGGTSRVFEPYLAQKITAPEHIRQLGQTTTQKCCVLL